MDHNKSLAFDIISWVMSPHSNLMSYLAQPRYAILTSGYDNFFGCIKSHKNINSLLKKI